ncbi:lytic transglycosylase domain-containing protein [Actinoplanes auranticolor]|uniref:lytic transglycosylase domain-containing protein n=1 Tax=Actinoplanes auranticolor TaxID=47988 RepID=UPI001BB33090|nr:murein transglycosylase [Actinoplanes auranticolor]
MDGTKPGYKAAGSDKATGTDKATPGDKTDKGSTPPDKTATDGKADNKDGAPNKDKAGDDNKDKAGDSKPGDKAPSTAAAASQGRATRVLRRANPVRVARSTARSTSAWAKRPSGRLILPAIIAVLLLGAAGTAGAYLVPRALEAMPTPSVTPDFGLDGGASAGGPSGPAGPVPGLGGIPSASAPVGGVVPGTQPPVGGAVGGARPADVLASWAQDTGTRAGIPVVAVQAYGYAELVVTRTTPSCHLSWTTIAAIAKVESSHGSANGAVLNVDGSVAPPIFGLPLDGKGGRQEIRDTDQGALDGDAQFDRALGPLQFIPQTWNAISVGNGVDADNNGVSDPNDIDDASLAAAKYLCQGGRDLARPDAWWDAILSYNAVRPYAQKVFDAANEYGQRSRV